MNRDSMLVSAFMCEMNAAYGFAYELLRERAEDAQATAAAAHDDDSSEGRRLLILGAARQIAGLLLWWHQAWLEVELIQPNDEGDRGPDASGNGEAPEEAEERRWARR